MPREKYLKELDAVNQELVSFGELVCTALDESMEGIKGWDMAHEKKVILLHKKINRQFLALDEQCMGLIAREQPLASDLRFVMSSLESARRLERCGDYAYEIARTAILLKKRMAVGVEELSQMEQTASQALRMATKSFATKDFAIAREAFRLEEENDAQFKLLIAKLKAHMAKSHADGDVVLRTFAIAHYYERAADYAERIARSVGYVAKGERKYLLD